ncbi:MAG: glycosyltransferase [Acidobacteria bacterium]|nr:glycosyltransferase [Acidobacteriota bacterium]
MRLEVLVVDDGSTYSTASIVQRIANQDQRGRLINIAPGQGENGNRRYSIRRFGWPGMT